jgi:perosamine synthetase
LRAKKGRRSPKRVVRGRPVPLTETAINQIEPYITEREIEAVTAYMRSGGWLTEFEKTRELEKMISNFLGIKHAVVVTNGTVGLYLALLALGVGRGDSVVVPNYTMIASPNSVRWACADVILADTERDTLCLDTNLAKLARNTKALMYVSINGRSGSMDDVTSFCKENGLFLIEDACQAFGSKWRGKKLGTFGDVGVFSLSPHKIITTGQGGVVVTDDDEIYERLLKLKDFSRVSPGVDAHTGIGFNFKFTDLQAVIGIEQMRNIEWRMNRKKWLYRQYQDGLAGLNNVEFLPMREETVPWFVDVILQGDRDSLVRSLKEQKIGSRPFYPPIHSQAPYRELPGDFPVSDDLAPRGVWLPSSLKLEFEDTERVCESIHQTLVA